MDLFVICVSSLPVLGFQSATVGEIIIAVSWVGGDFVIKVIVGILTIFTLEVRLVSELVWCGCETLQQVQLALLLHSAPAQLHGLAGLVGQVEGLELSRV